MKAMPLFDAAESSAQRDQGMQLAAEMRANALSCARQYALGFASGGDSITIDDVQRFADRHGLDLGNAAGSIFKGKEWECIGWKKSERVSNHARSIRIWRLKG